MNIEKCAEAIKAEENRIDLLVLNAGKWRCKMGMIQVVTVDINYDLF